MEDKMNYWEKWERNWTILRRDGERTGLYWEGMGRRTGLHWEEMGELVYDGTKWRKKGNTRRELEKNKGGMGVTRG